MPPVLGKEGTVERKYLLEERLALLSAFSFTFAFGILFIPECSVHLERSIAKRKATSFDGLLY